MRRVVLELHESMVRCGGVRAGTSDVSGGIGAVPRR